MKKFIFCRNLNNRLKYLVFIFTNFLTQLSQACRNKLVQHLEHLLFYGADLNAQNASGNTPLHVCAVNNLEDCARVLLFRGCDKNALNFANQNPYQVAVISGNLDLAEIINKHMPEDVGEYFYSSMVLNFLVKSNWWNHIWTKI